MEGLLLLNELMANYKLSDLFDAGRGDSFRTLGGDFVGRGGNLFNKQTKT